MLGIGGGLPLAAGGAVSAVIGLVPSRSTTTNPIVAWGDSLTYGYPALAAALFDPPRVVVERAVGGQSSSEVAARQGGVPILVTLAGNEIPALLPAEPDLAWDFASNEVPGEWYAFSATGAPIPISCEGGILKAELVNTGPNFFLAGPQVQIGPLVEGQLLRVEFEIVEMTGLSQLQVGTLYGSWTQPGSPQLMITEPGSYWFETEITDDKYGALIELGFIQLSTETMNGVLKLANVRVFRNYVPANPVAAITTLSTEPVNDQGPWSDGSRRIAGTLMGVDGDLGYDGTANFTFTRTSPGAAVSAPPASAFVPADALAYRQHTAWIWVGRNNIADPDTVEADIAAMVQSLGHSRYLVGSILNGEGEAMGSDEFDMIASLNADLAAQYGTRFVDLRAALMAAHDDSAGDLQDVATGVPPRSLRSNAIHLNLKGQAVVAQAFQAATLSRGW
ncbi:SGNH/GDSL hydrolase family protein [Devosia rhizoryzae]|uniref:SGNH/GDSL hydrolase family protein n=1 Tax=Devosia rhizoryzae TaxID=2774137 RepID=A0ABX7C9I4_9HYPH|nr:SGNH/GDSL hydrolase family protein [Devosia rhizoryzae]QQR40382.1 SGNH/GDSL hydrolase family protein [Devosia rhizoryzae]